MAINPLGATMHMQAGNIISAWGDYKIAGIQADMQASAQAYSNSMRKLSSAQQQNSVTLAQQATIDKSQRLSETLQMKSLQDRGSAKVSAAAAGVAGNSVQAVMVGLKRSALRAQDARLQNLGSAWHAAEHQKKMINLAGILGQDISVIPRPDPASALLGLGASMVDTYDANQPEGAKLGDTVNGWFKS